MTATVREQFCESSYRILRDSGFDFDKAHPHSDDAVIIPIYRPGAPERQLVKYGEHGITCVTASRRELRNNASEDLEALVKSRCANAMAIYDQEAAKHYPAA